MKTFPQCKVIKRDKWCGENPVRFFSWRNEVVSRSATEAARALTNSAAFSTLPESLERGHAFFVLPRYL